MGRRVQLTESIDALMKQLEAVDTGWKAYECRLVTPMYGGGVKRGEVDKEMPIRASSIRGQLRFWWRIACGPFKSSQEMFARETAIWGGIGDKSPTASKVDVHITQSNGKVGLVSSKSQPYGKSASYGFGAAANNGEAQWLQEGFEFSLRIRYPKTIAEEVDASLRWWVAFGGLGARTRRGFGAVRCDEIGLVTNKEIERAGCRVMHAEKQESTPIEAWKTANARLMKFRQGPGFARNDGNPRPGRSFWPEPDQLRRDTNKNDDGRHMPEHKSGNVFPRAAFGMPIIFDFHKTSEPDNKRTELLPATAERMASPLILGPTWMDRHWRATALLLPTWKEALTMPLRYKSLPGKIPSHWPGNINDQQDKARYIRPNQQGAPGPMVKADGSLRADDPLSAFMQFFAEGK